MITPSPEPRPRTLPRRTLLRRLWPRTLLSRALLIVFVPLAVLQMVTAYVFYESHWDQVSKRLAQGLAGDILVLVDSLTGLHDATSRQWLHAEAAQRMDITLAFEPGGVLPGGPANTSSLEGELRRALIRKGMTAPLRVDDRSQPGTIIVHVQLPDGVLRAAAPRGRLFSWTTYAFVLWTLGTSLLLLGIASIFMRNQLRPVRRLARAADAFGKGRDVPNFRPEGAREVRQAALAFLAMRNRIQRQISERTAMLAGVSHDLRTPLTRMKLELEMMGVAEGVGDLKDDVTEMERMLDGYLAFARGEGRETARPCDLAELLGDAVRKACRKGGEVELDTEGDLELHLKPNAFRRCMNNLLDNSMRYGRHVLVTARRLGATIEVTVDDDGPGIPASKREDVFRPFVRLERSRNPATGGVGLGLAIVRDVVRAHGGEIILDDAPTGGLRVRVRLPV